jgi:hypothetical protein
MVRRLVGQRLAGRQVLQPVPALVPRLARPRWLLSEWLLPPELVSALRRVPDHSIPDRLRPPRGSAADGWARLTSGRFVGFVFLIAF